MFMAASAWVPWSGGDLKYTRFDVEEPTMVFEENDDSGSVGIVPNYGDEEPPKDQTRTFGNDFLKTV